MKWSICLFIATFHASMMLGQLAMSPELQTALDGKMKFDEIMRAVTHYYAERNYMDDPVLFREFKKWNRWAWFACRHLDQEGKVADSYTQYNSILKVLEHEQLEINSGRSNSGVWSSVGPYTVSNGIGRADRIFFHPTNPDHLYAGTPGSGLWQSTNGGDWWTAMHGYMPGLGVSGMIVDIDNPSNLYALTGDGDSNANGSFVYARSSVGVLKSIDGGASWKLLSRIVPDGTVFSGYTMIQSRDFHWVFLAGTSDGLYRSLDYGMTWTRNTTIGSTDVFDIEQTINGYVYAATRRNVYISSDWGSSFDIVPNSEFAVPPTTATQRTTLAVCPSFPDILYVQFGGNALMYRSSDYGENFQLVNATAPTSVPYMSCMAVNPTDTMFVVCGSLKVRVSLSAGAGFTTEGSPGIHDDIHDLAYNPHNNILYAAGDGGIYESIDNGLSWVDKYNGMNATQYYHMGCPRNNNSLMLAGAQDNGVHFQNGGNPFVYVNGGDGYDSKFKWNDSNTAFFSINAGVFRYTVSNNNSTVVLTPAPNGDINNLNFFFPHLAIHPANDDTIYAGYISRLYRSFNNGSTWDTVNISVSNGFQPAGGLAVSAAAPNRIYAANQNTVRLSDDIGTNWTTISGNQGWPPGFLTITDIQTRNTNANEVWVTFGGFGTAKVIYSSNSGTTWNDVSGTLPDIPVYCIEHTDDGDAYIGTDAGVYFKDAFMSDWTRFSNGMPALPVTEVIVDEVNGSIKAATFARGIWQSDLYSDCGPFLLLEGEIQGQNFYQSGGFIETSQFMPGYYGNELRLRSPTRIIFEDGFSAGRSSYLRALIGPCGQGVFNVSENPEEEAKMKAEALQVAPHGDK